MEKSSFPSWGGGQGDQKAASSFIEPASDVDPLDEDMVERAYLESKPTCFIILGKPGAGSTSLAALLADKWKCQLINGKQVVEEAMKSQAEVGIECARRLYAGERESEEFVIRLIGDKVNSPQVAHSGYVLDGFPCPSDNKENGLSIKDQLDLIKSWKLNPDFIVNIKIPDGDLRKRRSGQMIDPKTGLIYTKDDYDPPTILLQPSKNKKGKDEEHHDADDDDEASEGGEGGKENDEGVEEEGSGEVFEEEPVVERKPFPKPILSRLLRRTDDSPDNITTSIDYYNTQILPVLETYMAGHNQKHVIELDGNKSKNDLLSDLLQRVACYVHHKTIIPVRLMAPEVEEGEEEGDGGEEEVNEEEEEAPEEDEEEGEEEEEEDEEGGEEPVEEEPEPIEVFDIADNEELLRTVSGSHMVAARCRWKRSKWGRTCPVALQRGDIVPGKAEFSVGFLDKFYVMSTVEAMESFMENPRRYLLPPQPRVPCKLVVSGPPLSGKTSLCQRLAEQYSAQVISMEGRMGGVMDKERLRREKLKLEEVTRLAISTVHDRLQAEFLERHHIKEEQRIAAAEAAQRKIEEGKRLAEEEKRKRREEEEEEEGKRDENDDVKKTDDEEDHDVVISGNSSSTESELTMAQSDELSSILSSVTLLHPEVQAIVRNAMAIDTITDSLIEESKTDEFYVNALIEVIRDCEKEALERNPLGPRHGGWILDDCLRTRQQWKLLVDLHATVLSTPPSRRTPPPPAIPLPDHVIVLKDMSPGGETLIERWCLLETEKLRAEICDQPEEELSVGADVTPHAPLFAKRGSSSKVLRKSVILAPSIISQASQDSGDTALQTDVNNDSNNNSPMPQFSKEDDDVLNVANRFSLIPDVADRRLDRKALRDAYESDWADIAPIIQGCEIPLLDLNIGREKGGEEGVAGGLEDRGVEDLVDEVVKTFNNMFVYVGWERTEADEEEEEAEFEVEGEEEEEEEEEPVEEEEVGEEEDEPNPDRDPKRLLGETSWYCPVSLVERGVLWPGTSACAAKYREKIYYIADPEARDRFLADPNKYLPVNKPATPPPMRLLILGPKGSGRTLHGRHLAKKLGLFHIQFHERLQEMVIAKSKRMVGAEYDDDQDDVFPPLVEDDVAVASEPVIAQISEHIDPPAYELEIDADTLLGGARSSTGARALQVQQQPRDGAALSAEDKLLEAAEDEAEVAYTADETAILAYLGEGEALPTQLLQKILNNWWNEEPIKSTGFILEGFPNTTEEAELLADSGFFPDAALFLNVSESDVMARLLPTREARWREKRGKKLEYRRAVHALHVKRRNEAISARRKELEKENTDKKLEKLMERQEAAMARQEARAEAHRVRALEKARRAAAGGDEEEEVGEDEEVEEEGEGEEEEEEGEDIEAIIAEEFADEEEEEEEEEETEEEAMDRIRTELSERYESMNEQMSEIKEKLLELGITRFSVDASRRPMVVRYVINKKLKPLVEFRQSMFERVYPVSVKQAEKLISTGYKQPSRFGRWCPVKLLEGDWMQTWSEPGTLPPASFPVTYGQHIYFLSSKEARDQFTVNPLVYLKQPSPKPIIPIRLAIIGPPKSGKTTVTRRFMSEYGCMHLSIGEVLRTILSTQPHTELSECISSYIYEGHVVPDECAVQALEVMLMNPRCLERGFILDGYPVTKEQVELMERRSIIPVRVIELMADIKEIANRATLDRYSPAKSHILHDSAEMFAARFTAWRHEVYAVRDWYSRQHDNYTSLNGEKSHWWVWNQCMEVAHSSVTLIQEYVERMDRGQAACIYGMCIRPHDFHARLGEFGQYCPVNLAECQLVDCSHMNTLQYAAEYNGRYYKLAGPVELAKFLANPQIYIPPLAPHKLPPADKLPHRITAAEVRRMFPAPIEFKGYCPVTYYEGKQRYESIIDGDPDLVVEYQGKLYYMATEEKLQQFMRIPGRYTKVTLPRKLPPKKEPVSVNGLPMLGYMEQTVAAAITKALTAVGNLKPKYPFINATSSALVYVAFYLKAYNSASPEYIRKKYQKKLEQFEEQCNLIGYLGSHMTKKYKELKDRPIDFDFKLKKFIELRSKRENLSLATY